MSALQALFDYGPRYARVLRTSRLGFKAPTDTSAFEVNERLEGNATTDFGAPGIAPAADRRPVSAEEIRRFEKVLKACWQTFDDSIMSAGGKSLHTGPRGGGRQVDDIIRHVLESNVAYLSQVGWKLQRDSEADAGDDREQIQQAILSALTSSARGEIPAKGPRGGLRWSPRYFVRRVAWHILDHAWEIEDRIL